MNWTPDKPIHNYCDHETSEVKFIEQINDGIEYFTQTHKTDQFTDLCGKETIAISRISYAKTSMEFRLSQRGINYP